MRLFWKIFLRLNGWKAVNEFPHSLKKGIILIGPHTSGWDFVYGLAFRSILKINNAKYLGKQELFRGPFGFFFRWMGGTPVDRSAKRGMVDQVVEKFNNADSLFIALAPEGTRKKVDRLRTGFYHIALKAGIPIVMISLDYSRKELSIATPFYLTGNQEIDLKKIITYFAGFQGKHPENGLTHLLEPGNL